MVWQTGWDEPIHRFDISDDGNLGGEEAIECDRPVVADSVNKINGFFGLRRSACASVYCFHKFPLGIAGVSPTIFITVKYRLGALPPLRHAVGERARERWCLSLH